MRTIRHLILVLMLMGGVCVAAEPAVPLPQSLLREAPTATPAWRGSCGYARLPGLEFAFADLDPSLADGHFVLWRRSPKLVSEPLAAHYGGRRGKLSGEFFWEDGERWFPAMLDDCTQVYAMDTSAGSPEGPMLHLQSVARIYYLRHLEFARSLVGQRLMVFGPGLEPLHRLYTADNHVSYPLVDGELVEVLGVETHRYGHTKGLGGFYVLVRNSIGQTGLIKFHHDYLFGEMGEPLWSMLNASGSGDGAMLPPPSSIAQMAK